MKLRVLFRLSALTGLVVAAAASAIAGEAFGSQPTNRVYRTAVSVGQFSDSDYEGDYANYRLRLEREMATADQDPNGNWGGVTNGLQISARFYHGQFTNGQPVCAIVLVRNVGSRSRYVPLGSWENYPFDLSLSHEGKPSKPLIPRLDPVESGDGSARGGSVEPGTQWRFSVRLDKIFDLTAPGFYQLAVERAFIGESNRVFKAGSGTATFQILAKPSKRQEPPVPQTPAATNRIR